MEKKREQNLIVDKLRKEMQKKNLDALLLTSPGAVYYSTGFASAVTQKQGNLGSSMSVVTSEGNVYLVCNEFEKQNADTTCENVSILSYPTWIFIEDFAVEGMTKDVQSDPMVAFNLALECIPRKGTARVGIEPQHVPGPGYEHLIKVLGRDNLVDCTPVLVESRAIKTPWEIDTLRTAAHYAEAAMMKLAQETVPGMTEGDLARLFNLYCFEQSSNVVDVVQGHIVGPNFSPAYVPRDYRIQEGDLVRLDGGPNVCGYNSDIGRTFAVGRKTDPRREQIFDTLYSGLTVAMDMIGPGVRMCDVFNAVQKTVWGRGETQYIRGHHGHSIGCSRFCEEYPFIAPAETRVFEPGMVFCVELPWYSTKNHSYIMEDTILITENGVERFTTTPSSLYL